MVSKKNFEVGTLNCSLMALKQERELRPLHKQSTKHKVLSPSFSFRLGDSASWRLSLRADAVIKCVRFLHKQESF
jgi:hypothetical protein